VQDVATRKRGGEKIALYRMRGEKEGGTWGRESGHYQGLRGKKNWVVSTKYRSVGRTFGVKTSKTGTGASGRRKKVKKERKSGSQETC